MTDFPKSPTPGQKFPDPKVPGEHQWEYNADRGVWDLIIASAGGAVSSNLFPNGREDKTIVEGVGGDLDPFAMELRKGRNPAREAMLAYGIEKAGTWLYVLSLIHI